MLSLGVWGLDRGSMWQDESVSFDVAHRSVVEILRLVRHVDVVHAAYYLLLHLWMMPGGGEVWMRVPSVVAAAAAAATVGAVGARLASTWVGLFVGLLFAVTPLVSFYAQEGRSTSIVCALVLIATYCLVRADDDPRPGWRIGYVAAMVLAVVFHEFAILAVLAHAATLMLAGTLRRLWRWWVPAAGAVAFVTVPLAVLSGRQSGQVGWLPAPTRATVTGLVTQFVGVWPVALVLTGALVVVGVAGLRPNRGRIDLATLGLPLAVLPPLLLLIASQVQPLYHVRYVLFAIAGVPFLAGGGLDRLLRRWLGGKVIPVVLIAVLLPVGVFAAQLPIQRFERTTASRNDDLAAAAAIIARTARPGDAVVFLPRKYRAAALAYPESFSAVDDVALHKSPVQASNLRGSDWSVSQVRARLLMTTRVWVIGRPHLSLRPGESGAASVRQVLQDNFTREQSYAVHGLSIALYVRRQAAR